MRNLAQEDLVMQAQRPRPARVPVGWAQSGEVRLTGPGQAVTLEEALTRVAPITVDTRLRDSVV